MRETTRARWGAAALVLGPALLAAALWAHPYIGNPGDPGFLALIAEAVTADPTGWALVHVATALASGLLILSFLALRSYLRKAGDATWSAVGVPFIVMGSLLFAMLPAMELAPVAALESGADIVALQGAIEAFFPPIMISSGVLYLLGTLAFVKGLVATRVLDRRLTRVVATALTIAGVTRIAPLAVTLFYVGPAAGILAMWPLAYKVWKEPQAQGAAGGPAASAA